MANTANLTHLEEALDINNIRKGLQRMEDSIIFSLIERSQFRVNAAVYEPDNQQLTPMQLHELKMAGSNGCLGDWFIYQTECLHAQVHRYQHPMENPFFGPLPEPTLGNAYGSHPEIRGLIPKQVLAKFNKKLLEVYRKNIVPLLCEEGDDGNYGSTAVQDVHVVQTLATRMYFSVLTAEAKFRVQADKANALINAHDHEGLLAFVSAPEIETQVERRVVLKSRSFSQTITSAVEGQKAPTLDGSTEYKICAESMGKVYKEFLLPLSRDVQVEYLMVRSDGESIDSQSAKRQRKMKDTEASAQ